MAKEKIVRVSIPNNASKKTAGKLIQAALKKAGASNKKAGAVDEIQIPESVDQKAEQSIAAKKQEQAQGPAAPVKTVTEIQAEKDLSPFKFAYWFNTDAYNFIELDIRTDPDYSSGKWHYIPWLINPEVKHEHKNKKYCFEIFCIDEKVSLRRLTKIIKRRCPGKKIEWMDFDANDLKNSIAITEQLTQK